MTYDSLFGVNHIELPDDVLPDLKRLVLRALRVLQSLLLLSNSISLLKKSLIPFRKNLRSSLAEKDTSFITW